MCIEGADLVRDLAEDCGDRPRIQRRAVGRDPGDRQPAGVEGGTEPAEERFPDAQKVRGGRGCFVQSPVGCQVQVAKRLKLLPIPFEAVWS